MHGGDLRGIHEALVVIRQQLTSVAEGDCRTDENKPPRKIPSDIELIHRLEVFMRNNTDADIDADDRISPERKLFLKSLRAAHQEEEKAVPPLKSPEDLYEAPTDSPSKPAIEPKCANKPPIRQILKRVPGSRRLIWREDELNMSQCNFTGKLTYR